MGFQISLGKAMLFSGIIMILSFVRVDSGISGIHMTQDQKLYSGMISKDKTLRQFRRHDQDSEDENDCYISTGPVKSADSSMPTNNADPVSKQLPPPVDEKSVELEWSRNLSYYLADLLSPDIFAQVDPFEYLLRKTAKRSSYSQSLQSELTSLLNSNRVPRRYIPYARILQSILRVQNKFRLTPRYIEEIRNDDDRSSVPYEISSPPAFSSTGLFSADIFDDPNPPVQLITKLMQIPKNGIPNLIIQLENYVKMSKKWNYVPSVWYAYNWYARDVLEFLETNSYLDDLKPSKDESQRILTSGQNFTNASMKNEPDVSAM